MSDSASSGDFVTVALQHHVLTAESAQRLCDLVTQRGGPPSDVALEEGILDAVEVDIISILQHPTEAVPGYEVLGLLGRGGMGVVFRARQRNLDREVALKTLLLSQLSDREALARFQREALTIARLQHPNVVSVYDLDKHQGRLYLAMELIVGHDLGMHIQREKRLDERSCWSIARQVAVGLALANRAGIVHRDIKPANILLVRDSQQFAISGGAPLVKISDFGLARLVDDGNDVRLTQSGRVVGTPAFMPPEQLYGDPLDCRADIYALGGTVYNMLTGQPPYQSQNFSQMLKCKVHEELPDVREQAPDVSADGARLIRAMMHPDVARRISDYDRLLERIDAQLAHLPRTSHSATADDATLEFSAPKAPRAALNLSRATQLILVVAGLLLIGTLLLAWQAGQRPPAPNMVPGEWSLALFNGESLAGWQPAPGSSVAPDFDYEGGRVLGIKGAATRSWQMPKEVTHYRLALVVLLNEAQQVSIQFGSDGAGRPRYGLQLQFAECELVDLTADSPRRIAQRYLPAAESHPSRRRFSIRIEQQQSHWWLFVDGEAIGYAPIDHFDEPHLLRIVAVGGPAQLEDVLVEELQPKPDLAVE